MPFCLTKTPIERKLNLKSINFRNFGTPHARSKLLTFAFPKLLILSSSNSKLYSRNNYILKVVNKNFIIRANPGNSHTLNKMTKRRAL